MTSGTRWRIISESTRVALKLHWNWPVNDLKMPSERQRPSSWIINAGIQFGCIRLQNLLSVLIEYSVIYDLINLMVPLLCWSFWSGDGISGTFCYFFFLSLSVGLYLATRRRILSSHTSKCFKCFPAAGHPHSTTNKSSKFQQSSKVTFMLKWNPKYWIRDGCHGNHRRQRRPNLTQIKINISR